MQLKIYAYIISYINIKPNLSQLLHYEYVVYVSVPVYYVVCIFVMFIVDHTGNRTHRNGPSPCGLPSISYVLSHIDGSIPGERMNKSGNVELFVLCSSVKTTLGKKMLDRSSDFRKIQIDVPYGLKRTAIPSLNLTAPSSENMGQSTMKEPQRSPKKRIRPSIEEATGSPIPDRNDDSPLPDARNPKRSKMAQDLQIKTLSKKLIVAQKLAYKHKKIISSLRAEVRALKTTSSNTDLIKIVSNDEFIMSFEPIYFRLTFHKYSFRNGGVMMDDDDAGDDEYSSSTTEIPEQVDTVAAPAYFLRGGKKLTARNDTFLNETCYKLANMHSCKTSHIIKFKMDLKKDSQLFRCYLTPSSEPTRSRHYLNFAACCVDGVVKYYCRKVFYGTETLVACTIGTGNRRGGLELNELHQLFVYADDMNMLGVNPQTIGENTDILLEASKTIGLEVNSEKTKYQNIVRNQNIKIGNLSFEEVEKFKYLEARHSGGN
ncbi:hypothetical protein ANN_09831 [Periplaneta americana]|uniref:Reverse transcriptase domain-containing protein n=1 Tax=Periplaneta americana TaxID=6978 RepID=A0ABQ8TME1_PERAM|nr:hypothetical protein ANN_09831 [Periplaneta americana]